MRVLYDDEFPVAYMQGYVHSDPESWSDGVGQQFQGQVNGLLGGAVAGTLHLVTGLHTGSVPLRIVLHDAEPPVDPSWEEVVEVAFRPTTSQVELVPWGDGGIPLDLPVADYRARWCAVGMDEGSAADTRLDGDPVVDRYELALWPSEHAPDAVLRETSRQAGYWHREARGEAHPPTPPPSPVAERAIAAAARVSRAALDGPPRSGDLTTVSASVRAVPVEGDHAAHVTGLGWAAGNGWKGQLDAPGDELRVSGFGHADLHLELRRLTPGVHVEVSWELGLGDRERTRTGSTLRLDVRHGELRVQHVVPVEWADDLRLVWAGLLEALQAHCADPSSSRHWDLGQEHEP